MWAWPWRFFWLDTCGFCTGMERVVGQQQIRGALQKTPRFVPTESCMPTHLYAHAHFGHLGPVCRRSCWHHGFWLHAWSPSAPECSGLLWGIHELAPTSPSGGWAQACCMCRFPYGPCIVEASLGSSYVSICQVTTCDLGSSLTHMSPICSG